MGRFPGEGGQGHRCDGRVKVQAEKPPVDSHYHNERQYRDKQPADERDRPEGDTLEKAAAFHRRDDLLGKNRLLRGSKARRVHNGRNKALDNIKEGHHQLQPIGHDAFGNGKPDKQFQRVLRLFDLCEAAAGFHNPDDEEQHQKRKTNRPYRVVDVDNDAPNRAALELFRALGDELPDLGQVLVPGV